MASVYTLGCIPALCTDPFAVNSSRGKFTFYRNETEVPVVTVLGDTEQETKCSVPTHFM